MKTLIFTLLFLFFTQPLFAQCVGEVKDVKQDEVRGSIIVETEYTLNGSVVQLGKSRYLETTGTEAEIIAKAKSDIARNCEDLIKRMQVNATYLIDERLKIQKSLTSPIITNIKPLLVGQKETKTEAIYEYKGKDIKVTYDEKNTTTLTP